ncbi:MAG: ElyC/SanA/YdcF family protein [Desulfomonilaceae bacterium]
MEEIGFLIKQIISLFIQPLDASLLLLLGGIVILLFKKSRWIGLTFISIGTSVLLVFSMQITGYNLLRPLEKQAGFFQDPSTLEKRGVKFIVVLASSVVEDGYPPAESWGSGVTRVMEGIRLAKGIHGSKLVLSGSAIPGRNSNETAMSRLPLEMGISRESLILNSTAFDTDDEARAFSNLVGTAPFGLVTSARHIPRSIKLFRKYGTNPISCPCDFGSLQIPVGYSNYFPNLGSLCNSHNAIHEYFGIWWIDLKRHFSRN